jgi:NAD(P)H dehydrogenase (quinone)
LHRVHPRVSTAPSGLRVLSFRHATAAAHFEAREARSFPGLCVFKEIPSMTIGITGASGHLATAALRHLLEHPGDADIVAVTRNPVKVEGLFRHHLTVRPGSFDDEIGLTRALAGVHRLLLIPGSDLVPGVRARQHRSAIRAAAAAGVRQLIYVSGVGARPGSFDGILETHFATEQALVDSGLPWTVLRMNVYADFQLEAARTAFQTGIDAAPDGAPIAFVSRDDVAAAAAALLATSGHDGVTYHATGPVSLTYAQLARALSDATGTPITYSPVTRTYAESSLAAAGVPPTLAEVLGRFQRAGRDGAFDLVTGDIERLTGRAARSPVDFLVSALGLAATN